MVRATHRRAFTMIELMAVCLIIGLLMTFVIIAAQGAARDAQREATRTTITKLENAMNQLIETVQSQRINPTQTHIAWASFVTTGGALVGSTNDKATMQRAQVIANYDEMRAQVPDVFWIQDKNVQTSSNPYPINFAGFQFNDGNSLPYGYVLPVGSNTLYNRTNGGVVPPAQAQPLTPGTGVYGASYGAAAGLLKNLGNVSADFAGANIAPTQLLPQGSDGVDNNGNTLIDDIDEGVQGNANVHGSVLASLQQHKHITARSEMLYALLVEGQSQFGAFVSKDDFTSKEIGDTDNDGLPEFLDGWGNPIQFFRWPVFYHSDVQRGVLNDNSGAPPPLSPYATVFETREQDPNDPNQTLMAVSWWSGLSNGGPAAVGGSAAQGFFTPQAFQNGGSLSGPAFMFQHYFSHMLVEPLSIGGASPNTFWDRSQNFYQRRAYYTRFLILSAGPDGLPGVPVLSEDALQSLIAGAQSPDAVSAVLQLEGQAAQWDLISRNGNPSQAQLYGSPFIPISSDTDSTSGLTFFDMGLDDITNHNLNSTAQVSAQ